ncbi:uncharacterized protein PHA67_020009 isoform 2-T2 [Liasis olivaceus]
MLRAYSQSAAGKGSMFQRPITSDALHFLSSMMNIKQVFEGSKIGFSGTDDNKTFISLKSSAGQLLEYAMEAAKKTFRRFCQEQKEDVAMARQENLWFSQSS